MMPSWLSHSTVSGKCQFSGVTQSRSLRVLRCPVRESVIFARSPWTVPVPERFLDSVAEGLEGAGTPLLPLGQDQVTSMLCGGTRRGPTLASGGPGDRAAKSTPPSDR